MTITFFFSPETNVLHAFFISNTFISNARLKLPPKNKQKVSNTPRLNFCYLKIIHTFHARYHLKIIRCTPKNIYEIIQLIVMKMETKKKIRLQRRDINTPRSRHRHRYSKFKRRLIMKMLVCTKQHLNNIQSSIYEKVKQHCGWNEKNRYI